MKNIKNINLDPSNKLMAGIENLTRKEMILRNKELNEKYAKQTWYLELIIAACVGASLALGFVVVHGMIVTEWTW